jgi:hypothetical protein
MTWLVFWRRFWNRCHCCGATLPAGWMPDACYLCVKRTLDAVEAACEATGTRCTVCTLGELRACRDRMTDAPERLELAREVTEAGPRGRAPQGEQ